MQPTQTAWGSITWVYASGASFVALFPQSLGASRALCYVRRALYLARNSADPPPAAQIVRFASLCTTHSLAAPAMPGPAPEPSRVGSDAKRGGVSGACAAIAGRCHPAR